ncbi:MAG: hypothetical protein GTO29_08650 [Candidatus Latescibacteria bacterium]|nr:hypothetical protein [Candidatus Latescibacterota bacterium]NIO56232.1 hypothetical protein [Candidatus Latescibacterota bacterium]
MRYLAIFTVLLLVSSCSTERTTPQTSQTQSAGMQQIKPIADSSQQKQGRSNIEVTILNIRQEYKYSAAEIRVRNDSNQFVSFCVMDFEFYTAQGEYLGHHAAVQRKRLS